jgi:hypothetical protein
MSIVQLDIQKIEQLLNSATTSRQRKMYQALLDKARSQQRLSTDSKASQTTPEIEKKAKTKTNHLTETLTEAKTTKKQKKTTRKKATTSASPAEPESQTPVSESTTQLTQQESEAPQQQQPDVEGRIFQALGTILAAPYLKSARAWVTIDSRKYDLRYVPGFQRQAYRLLLEELEENGSSKMFLKLYPNVTFDQSSAEPILSFSLANFSLNLEKINDYPKGFVLRGIWQYIPKCNFPVITIYRNLNQLPAFKKLKGSRQFSFAQPRHLPVVWDAPVEPFKYNPQQEKELQMSRYFVEVRAIIKDGLYVVEEMLLPPTLDIPKYIKSPKKK